MMTSLRGEYERYKALAEAAIEQVPDAELSHAPDAESNSIAALVWHIAGNLESRFTDFRTSDGEKPWRNRDDEFEPRTVTRADLLGKWERGWRALFTALDAVTDADLAETITIRSQPLRIDDALHRSLAHTCYHVGQIVYLGKVIRGGQWKCLSIPRGASQAFNQSRPDQRPAAHAAALRKIGSSPSHDPSSTTSQS